MMHAVDWFPTIMSLVGGTVPSGIDGVSQWESLVNGSPSPRTEFVYNMDNIEKNAAIRHGDWKLIQGGPFAGSDYNGWYPVPGVDNSAQGQTIEPDFSGLGPDDYQLFNIKDDPTEHFDVKDRYPEVLAKLKARLEDWRKSAVPANFPPDDQNAKPSNYDNTWSPGWC